jgi:hypothetical protein
MCIRRRRDGVVASGLTVREDGASCVKIPARVNLLLAVHERRVERALAVLQHCNEQLRRAESERAEQYERLLDTR